MAQEQGEDTRFNKRRLEERISLPPRGRGQFDRREDDGRGDSWGGARGNRMGSAPFDLKRSRYQLPSCPDYDKVAKYCSNLPSCPKFHEMLDCISWYNSGFCRKQDQCPYKHRYTRPRELREPVDARGERPEHRRSPPPPPPPSEDRFYRHNDSAPPRQPDYGRPYPGGRYGEWRGPPQQGGGKGSGDYGAADMGGVRDFHRERVRSPSPRGSRDNNGASNATRSREQSLSPAAVSPGARSASPRPPTPPARTRSPSPARTPSRSRSNSPRTPPARKTNADADNRKESVRARSPAPTIEAPVSLYRSNQAASARPTGFSSSAPASAPAPLAPSSSSLPSGGLAPPASSALAPAFSRASQPAAAPASPAAEVQSLYYGGRTADGRYDGPGVLLTSEGELFIGNWKSGQRSGPGTKLCLRNLSVRLAPPSTSHEVADGRSASALLASTLLPPVNCGTANVNGLQVQADCDSRVDAVWDRDGVPSRALLSYSGGRRYTGEVTPTGLMRHGKGTEWLHTGGRVDGEWRADKRHGRFIETRPDGTTEDFIFLDDEQQRRADPNVVAEKDREIQRMKEELERARLEVERMRSARGTPRN